jgi:hypothetical protein
MKKHLPFVVASIQCFPFCAFAAVFLVAAVLRVVGVISPDAITVPLVRGLFLLSSWPASAALILLFPSTSLVAAWFQETKTRTEIALTSGYSIVITLHFGYVLWCLIAKPGWDL